ncbi:MAG: hypothetical protein WA939_04990 [Nodosilinea sp.]
MESQDDFSSRFTGVFLFGLGALRCGDVVRSLPYSVVGGFVANTGWLLIKGACVLVMAPASVQPQWHEALRETFNLQALNN